MPLLTAQQISKYYELFSAIDVTFTKEVIQAIGLVAKQIFLKYLGLQVPCVIYSSSMIGAKIVANVKSDLFTEIRTTNNVVALRYCVADAETTNPVSFYVTSRIVGYTPYASDSPELNFVTLSFTQRPPDDLIGTLGQLIEANTNAARRKEERIAVTAESLRKLGLLTKDAIVLVQGVPRKCIVRDLSFSGAKLIVTGIGKFLLEKEVVLRLELEDRRRVIELKGKIVRYDAVEGRRDIAALAVLFDEKEVPLEFKMHINDYLTTVRQVPGDDAGEV